MQYLRQSLLTICVCLYGLIALTLGLSWLFPQTEGLASTERPLVSGDLPFVSDASFYDSLPVTVELPLESVP
jgi:hypothetical protein